MAPSKPARALKIHVPRQNAHRLGPSVTAEVQRIAKQEGALVQLPIPIQDQPGSSTASSSENASEWNSLLINARAARGPQWDLGTQQFLVENGSELYYDPTPLHEAARAAIAAKEGTANAGNSQQNEGGQSATSNLAQQQQPRPPFQAQAHYGYPNVSSPMMAQQRSSGYPGTPMSAGTPGGPGYYGDAMTTPTRPGHAPMDMTPDSRRITRGMSEFQGMYGS